MMGSPSLNFVKSREREIAFPVQGGLSFSWSYVYVTCLDKSTL
jgi:hypothetical protein